MPIDRYTIRNVPVDEVLVADLVEQAVILSGKDDRSRYICYLNAHVYNLARSDPRLHAVLEKATICYADGTSVVWAANQLGGNLSGRLTAADFFPRVMRTLGEQRRRLFVLGGQPGVADRAARAMIRDTAGCQLVGSHHGYFDVRHESAGVVAQIRAAQPDVLIVGMGTPKQELWIAEHLTALQVPLIWAVGALLDYHAGEEKRCPTWMGDHGLEWLYRLLLNPRRHAMRYLWGNPRFVWSVLTARRPRIRRGGDPARSAADAPVREGSS